MISRFQHITRTADLVTLRGDSGRRGSVCERTACKGNAGYTGNAAVVLTYL